MSESTSLVVRVNKSQVTDDALHPADITLEWVNCGYTIVLCEDEAALAQPVITCVGEMKMSRFGLSSSETKTARHTCLPHSLE